MTIKTTILRNGSTATTAGRDARGRFSRLPVIVITTPQDHWYRTDDQPDPSSNDTLCRGCGHHGHFDYILDYQPCTTPATPDQVFLALGMRADADHYLASQAQIDAEWRDVEAGAAFDRDCEAFANADEPDDWNIGDRAHAVGLADFLAGESEVAGR